MQKLGLIVFLGIISLMPFNDAIEAFDFSNLDIQNFRFFRNLPSQNPATAPYTNPITELFIKKKAVLQYFERLLFGTSLYGPPLMIEFHPHYGEAWQSDFEHTYGRRAERLIDLLGSGASIEELKYYGAIPKDFGSYH